MCNIGGGVAQCLFIEDPKALIDGAALGLNLIVNHFQLLIQLSPVLRIGSRGKMRARITAIDCLANLKVILEDRLFKVIILVGTNVEDEFVPIEKVINLIHNYKDLVFIRLNFRANLVIGECFLKVVKRGDKNLLQRRFRITIKIFSEALLRTMRELDISVKQRKDIIVDPVLLAKVQIETVTEDLRLRISYQMFWNKHHECTLGWSSSSKKFVGLVVVGEKSLAEKRENNFGFA
mmetsp:Transcript_14700/g.20507  ORF Transcript_14700/g.20507 Transcript_14700/m.20507 type:complete len:235 (-) Transcript_14700:1654-2358(-)